MILKAVFLVPVTAQEKSHSSGEVTGILSAYCGLF